MADQAITALPKKTYSGSSQIASTDYLLGIDSAEGYQMLIQDLGEYIINRVTASLAGSTQTLASAISALNSNLLSVRGTSIPANSDLNTYTSFGKYYANTDVIAATLSHCPTTASFSLYVLAESGSQIKQMLIVNTYVTKIHMRQRSASNTWGEWEQIVPHVTEHPAITDVLTAAEDITINSSYVSVRDGMVILDCNFTQTSTTKTNRFTFKNGYTPIGSQTNIAPIFMYSNNAVSDTVLFINTSTLTMFGAAPVANQGYYFRLVYFIK